MGAHFAGPSRGSGGQSLALGLHSQAVMRLVLSRCQLQRVPDAERRFMAVSTQRVCAGTIVCRGVRRQVTACAGCRHFVDSVRAGDSLVAIRCLYLEGDTVAEAMTEVGSLRVLDESEPVGSAIGPDPIVVSVRGEAAGVLTQRVLAGKRTWTKLGSLLGKTTPIVARSTLLGTVAAAMAAHRLPAILVTDGDELVGVVTRDELSRLAVP